MIVVSNCDLCCVIHYRPQRSWAKVIFSQECVKNSVHRGGGCLPQCMLGYTPPGTRPPQTRQADPPGTRPPPTRQADPPRPGRHHHPPRGADPPKQTPPWEQTSPRTRQTPPPREADCSIRSTSGRYASYWNAFLFKNLLSSKPVAR